MAVVGLKGPKVSVSRSWLLYGYEESLRRALQAAWAWHLDATGAAHHSCPVLGLFEVEPTTSAGGASSSTGSKRRKTS